jgi:dTMP kinase
LTLVVFDGLDASGKSTQGLIFYERLTKCGRTVLLRIHPSQDNFFGQEARRFLLSNGMNAHFSSAIFYMLDVIRSVLLYSWQKYDFIIFVRYLMGTAYLPYPLDRILYCFFASTVPTSDYMFFLDVPPEEASKRIRENRNPNALEMFESLENLRRIRTKALSLVSTGKWKIINGGHAAEEVEKDIAEKLGI